MPDGGSQTPSLEVQFSGTSAQILVTPSGGSGGQPADQTSLICSIAGDPAITNQTGALFFTGDITPAQSMNLQCTPGSQTLFAVLSCNQKKAGVLTGTFVWDVACPVAGQPEYVSSPAAGTTLTLAADTPANATATLTVSNTGAAMLNVTGTPGLAAPLSIAPATAMIGPGQSQPFTITCDGATPGTYLGNFTVQTNDADEASNAYGVDCTIRSAEFDGQPPPPGPIALATTQGSSVGAAIQVTNTGNAALVLGPLTGLSGRLSATQVPPGPIAAGGGIATISIGCDASVAGTSSQTLTFTTNDNDDGEGSIAYGVSCTVNAAPAPEFTSTPAAPGPFNLTTGQGTNVSAPLAISNVGNAPMNVTLQTPPAAPVSVTGVPGAPVGPGNGASLTVACDATNAGTFVRSFTLGTTDADEQLVTYNVTCNVGAPPPPEFDSVPASPGPLAISTFQGTNATAMLRLRNTGSTPLQITGFSALPAPFSLAPSVPATIPPGQSLDHTLTCSAAMTGFFTATLNVSTNDSNEGTVPFDLQCRVQPNAPELATAPVSGSSLAISTVAGEPSSAFIFFSNLGSQPLTLNVTPPLPPLTTSFASATLAPGENRALRVTCRSTDRVSTFQNIVVTNNDGDENPVNYLVTCNVAANARSSFRLLLTSGAFTNRKSSIILRDSFE